MSSYQLGSRGPEVRALQDQLAKAGHYRGPVDGDYGGGTQAAVSAFQLSKGLAPSGAVNADTWRALFGSEMPRPAIVDEGLIQRCLTLTGSFETGKGPPECFCGIGGDFDGQGISFGVLQWNFGQGTLQPLLRDMTAQHPDIVRGVFGNLFDAFTEVLASGQDELMGFARSVQHPVTHAVFEPWRGFAKTLGRTAEFQAVQTAHARKQFESGLGLCREYGLRSERAAALMFDIATQNGGISKLIRARIQADIQALPADLTADDGEVRRMEIVANRRAEAANPRWIDDVRMRKLTIARGAGTVHGIAYRLDEQFGIGLRPFAT